MKKNMYAMVFLLWLPISHAYGQTGTKADMFGASGLTLEYDKNIIINGNFSADYSNWSFDQGTGGYHIRYDGISDPGDIQVGSNPFNFNKGYKSGYNTIGAFDTYGDHTTGSGNFLMVDGRCNSTYIKIWKQTVLIQPHTYYMFAICVSSLKDNPNHPGVLIFNIGGKNIGLNIVAPYKGGATAPSAGGGWVRFEKIWYSDALSGNVLVSIENNNTETCDSEVDFGIDDIELKPEHKNTPTKTVGLRKMENILFQTSSDRIDSVYFQCLNKVTLEMIQNTSYTLYIKGYTDDRDDFEYNLDLSKRRSIAIKNYLLLKGISTKRITTNGFGETLPVESNDTDEGRKQNRRAEIYILQ
jgi:outer membrane protein OmpA-like peptidoglycan-associated protein